MRIPAAPPRPAHGVGLGAAGVAVITLVLVPFHSTVPRAVPALLLVMPVLVAAFFGGRVAYVVTTGFAVLAFASGFIPPVGTLRIHLSEDIAALVVFAAVALVLGELVVSAATTELGRREAEAARIDALEDVDKQRAMLLRSVSHDLRTPLSTIRAVASDLRGTTVYTPATSDELLGLVIDESDRLDRIVGNLLSYSRIEAGALHPTLEPVDLNELVETTTDRLEHLTRGVKVELDLDRCDPIVPADFSQLDQVLTNLVENAVRHSPEHGCITVRTSEADGRVQLDVIDDGDGVAGVDASRIFDSFVGTGSTTGIGLAICKAIVEAHGGAIAASNVAGRGACFSVTLAASEHDTTEQRDA